MEYLTDVDYKTAAENGISYDAAYKRFYNYGWPKEKAITHPIFPQFQNKKPRTSLFWKYEKIAVVGRTTFDYRVKQGMPPEMAATKMPDKTGKGVKK